ncbi:O-acetylserine/cysteine efflux transporter [Marmoricola sp. OAE513]
MKPSICIRWCFIDLAPRLEPMRPRHAALAVLVATIWGFNFVVIAWGMDDGMPPLLFVALRFAAVIVPAVFFVPKPDAPWHTILGVGLFMSLGQFGLLYSSMDAGMPPGLAALVLQAQVLFTVLIAAVWIGERPSSRQLLGVLVGAAGLVVVGVGRGGHIPAFALLLCLAGALSWGFGNVVSRRSGVKSGLSMAVWSSLVVPVPLALVSLVVDGPSTVGSALTGLSAHAVLSTLYTAGLASLVGYSIFNGLLAQYPAHSVVPFVLIAPPVAMVSAWVLLDQVPNAAELVGGLVVLVGVLVTTRASAARSGATALGVRRTGGVGDVDHRGDNAARGEVGAELVNLLDRAELR